MKNKTLSQNEWTYVSTVLITPEMQEPRRSLKNSTVLHTEVTEKSSIVRYVVVSSNSKQHPYLRIVGPKAGMLFTLIESWSLDGEQ